MSEKVLCEKSDLVAIADAVREATGSAENYNVGELTVATIEAISSANPTLQDKTVTPTALDQIITPDSNYDGLSQVTVKGDADLKAENITEGVTIFNIAGSNPYEKTTTDVEVSTQADLIAQISTALEGKTAAEPTLQAKTVTPSVSTQIVKPDNGYDGLSQVTVNGDDNFTPENIKSGVDIFGVIGSYKGSGSDNSGERQIASGTFSVEKTTTRNIEIATISGLSFKPQFVLCAKDSTILITSNSTYYVNGGFIDHNDNSYCIRARINAAFGLVSGTSYFNIIKNQDGFTVKSGSSTSTSNPISAGTYLYYAF